MILESDIAKFPPEQQSRIRKELQHKIGDGYPEKWLVLLNDGQIIYDEIGHAGALAAGVKRPPNSPDVC